MAHRLHFRVTAVSYKVTTDNSWCTNIISANQNSFHVCSTHLFNILHTCCVGDAEIAKENQQEAQLPQI